MPWSKRMFRRLRARLTVVCSVVTGLILIGMACGSLYLTERQLWQSGQAVFQRDFHAVLFHLRGQTLLDYTWLAQTEANNELILHVEDNGHPAAYPGTIGSSLRQRLVEAVRAQAETSFGLVLSEPPNSINLADTAIFSYTDPVDRQYYYAAAASIPMPNGWINLVLLKSRAPEEQQIFNLRWMFALLTLLAAALLWLFAWLFTGRALVPVEESRRRQVEFVSAASHELRSPLAVIRASLSALQTAPPAQAVRFSAAIDGECERMARLVGDLLALASADSGSWSVQMEQTELETLLLNISEAFEPMAHTHGVHITVQLPSEPLPRCYCDPHRIGQVLAALTDNALHYTPAGGKVTLTALPDKNGVKLLVRDTGPGISDADKTRIFERFYRADPSRSKKEHYGLGLSIAQEVMELHRGRLSVTDAPGGGAEFCAWLPRNPSKGQAFIGRGRRKPKPPQ